MTPEEFDFIINSQLNTCRDILVVKAREYAGDKDRLHNFKVAAVLQDITVAQALRGMQAKHTVSIYDMINSGETYPLELWGEKITDHINYLLLLLAVVCEEDAADPSDTDDDDPDDPADMWTRIFEKVISSMDEKLKEMDKNDA